MENSILITNCSYLLADEMAVFKVGNFIATVIISFLGILVNAAVIAIFARLRTKTSTDILMMALAFYDIFLVVIQNLFVHRNAYPFLFMQMLSPPAAGRVSVVAVALEGVIHICNTYTVVLLSLDRYLHVCHSTKAKAWCTENKAKRMQAALICSSVLYNSPRLYALAQVLAAEDFPVDSCFGYFQYPTGSLGTNDLYGYAYDYIAYIIVVYCVPLAVLCFSNVSLIRVIVQRRRFSMALRSSQLNLETAHDRSDPTAAGNRAIAILVIVTAVFSAFQVPVVIDQIMARPFYDGANAVHLVASDSVIINSSINCVMYTLSSSTFRRKLGSMVCFKSSQIAPDPTAVLQL